MNDREFYRDRKVFITGHTGFKGSWLCMLLLELGADICGYALKPDAEKMLFELSGVKEKIKSIYGDIRDIEKLRKVMTEFNPEIVIHMAAQPIVRESYKNPVDTYSINVMGTVNVMEAVRECSNAQSVVNVTTDKVYQNLEIQRGYVEKDMLNGYDPYSNSKSCSELVTSSYAHAFLNNRGIAVSTCRAGNVVGGGDFSKDRIIPDCYRAISRRQKIHVRNPNSVRPYQHVLDPLCTYLLIAHRQFCDTSVAGAYNIGPDYASNIKTGDIVDLFCNEWGENAGWEVQYEQNAPHEANYLYLNCDKVKRVLGWKPVWEIRYAMKKTVEWYKAYLQNVDISLFMKQQICDFMQDGGRV